MVRGLLMTCVEGTHLKRRLCCCFVLMKSISPSYACLLRAQPRMADSSFSSQQVSYQPYQAQTLISYCTRSPVGLLSPKLGARLKFLTVHCVGLPNSSGFVPVRCLRRPEGWPVINRGCFKRWGSCRDGAGRSCCGHFGI